LSNKKNNDTMKKAHESSNGLEKLAHNQGELLRSCPSLSYEHATSLDSENKINTAFDILFHEVMSIRKSNNTDEINRHICPGFNSPARRGTNH
jgi:hypothetical protein